MVAGFFIWSTFRDRRAISGATFPRWACQDGRRCGIYGRSICIVYQQVDDFAFDVIAHLAEIIHVIRLGWIGKAVVHPFAFPQPDGTFFSRRIAHRDHQVEIHAAKFIGQLGTARC